MDSFELNKIAGAVLGTMLVVFGIGIVGDMIFSAAEPETPAYVIAVATETTEGGEEPTAEAEAAIATLLADADPAAGEGAVRPCAGCHTFEQGGASRIGPNLYDVVERPIASIEGFNYSNAMRAYAEEAQTWGYEQLNAFLASPRQTVPGTTMTYAGMRNADTRADVIAYMRTLSADPAPLPEPPAETPQPAAGTAAPSPDQPATDTIGGDQGVPEQEAEGQPEGEQQGQAEQQQGEQAEAQQQDQAGQPAEGQQQDQAGQQPPQDQSEQQGAAEGQDQQTVLVVPPAGQAEAQQAQQQPAETEPQAEAPAPAEGAADLPPALALMSEVTLEDGQAEARKCQACHALDEAGGNRVGPSLWDIVNRPIAAVEGFSYSPALAEFGQGKEWDFATLDAFIQAPQQLVPGTKMIFPGIRNERDRAELLVYLNSLSGEPAPLPGAQ